MLIVWAIQQFPPITRTVLFLFPAQEEIETQTMKITCFTKIECPTAICQSGQIKKGEIALNPKFGYNKIIRIGDEIYEAKWISSYDTDIDIWFGETREDYIRCLEFGKQYLSVIIN